MNDLTIWAVAVFVGLLTSRILEALGRPILAKVVLVALVVLFVVYFIEPLVPFKPLLGLF